MRVITDEGNFQTLKLLVAANVSKTQLVIDKVAHDGQLNFELFVTCIK